MVLVTSVHLSALTRGGNRVRYRPATLVRSYRVCACEDRECEWECRCGHNSATTAGPQTGLVVRIGKRWAQCRISKFSVSPARDRDVTKDVARWLSRCGHPDFDFKLCRGPGERCFFDISDQSQLLSAEFQQPEAPTSIWLSWRCYGFISVNGSSPL